MNKKQLLTLSLLLPVFMGYAKRSLNEGSHKVNMANKDGNIQQARIGYVGTRNVSVVVDKNDGIVVVAKNDTLDARGKREKATYFNGSVQRYHGNTMPAVVFENPSYLQDALPGYYAYAAVVIEGKGENEPEGIIVGYTNDTAYALVRYHIDGTIVDPELFNFEVVPGSGKLIALAVASEGKHLKILAGSSPIANSGMTPLTSYNPDGRLAVSFDKANLASVTAIAVEKVKEDYKKAKTEHQIVVAGITESAVGGVPAKTATLVRYHVDGQVSEGFNFSGFPQGLSKVVVNSLAVQDEDQTIVAGGSREGGLLVRYNKSGELDYVDAAPGFLYTTVVVDRVNKNDIYVAGRFSNVSEDDGEKLNQSIVRRFTKDGRLNVMTFGENGTAYLYDGKLYGLDLFHTSKYKDALVTVGSLFSDGLTDKGQTAPFLYTIKRS
ncbi:MAG: hypothetical protein NT124_00750 [Candidatus Dependentiae bacterium]|nr:hypothetical protein [Candidatus Dependentiae bacterium]